MTPQLHICTTAIYKCIGIYIYISDSVISTSLLAKVTKATQRSIWSLSIPTDVLTTVVQYNFSRAKNLQTRLKYIIKKKSCTIRKSFSFPSLPRLYVSVGIILPRALEHRISLVMYMYYDFIRYYMKYDGNASQLINNNESDYYSLLCWVLLYKPRRFFFIHCVHWSGWM